MTPPPAPKKTAYPLFKPDRNFPFIREGQFQQMRKPGGPIPDELKITPEHNLISLTEELVQHMVKRVVLNPFEDITQIIDIADVRVTSWVQGKSIGHVGYKRSREGQTNFEIPVSYPVITWGGLLIETEKPLHPGFVERARYNWLLNMYMFQRGKVRDGLQN